MESTFSSLTGIASALAFVAVLSSPVWLAARLVGADYPTLLRSFVSLVIGVVFAMLSAAAGSLAIVLAPLAFLLSFKYILGTGLGGACMLAILAFLGYLALGQALGAAFHGL